MTKSTILIINEPDEVHVEIPQVPSEIDKNSNQYELSIKKRGRYEVIFTYQSKKLSTILNISKHNDFIAFADFPHNEAIALTQSEFIEYMSNHNVNDVNKIIVSDLPLFNGGDPSNQFYVYINENKKYPAEAENNNITGRVLVRFAIN